MPRIRAVGFDLGETLITYAEAPLSWTSLYRAALERVARALDVLVGEEQFVAAERVLATYNTRLTPRTTEVAAQMIFQQALATWPRADEAAIDVAITGFFGFFQQSLRGYDDTLPALRALRERLLRIGVLTDVPYGMPRRFVEQDLAQTQLASRIDHLVTSVDVGFRKPAPQGFQRLAQMMGCDPGEMLYVGNEPKDITGANAAGITSVLIDRERLRPSIGQAVTIYSLEEIASLLGQ